MHTSFANSVYVREALRKLFQQEQAGDSRYVVIALGKSLEVIQDATSDPAKVLETLDGPNFRKLFLRGQKSLAQFEISAYEEDLQRAKEGRACNAYDGSCQAQAETLLHLAEELAERERSRTTEFLAQFRSVVEQLARDNGRRTMVLISDGILLAPGRIPFGLLEAYFPGFHSTRHTRQYARRDGADLQAGGEGKCDDLYDRFARALHISGRSTCRGTSLRPL